MTLHLFQPTCPRCNQPTAIVRMFFSANGRVVFNVVCVTCGVELKIETSNNEIVIWAHENDQMIPTLCLSTETTQ
mgnify:CR=1 FL=1